MTDQNVTPQTRTSPTLNELKELVTLVVDAAVAAGQTFSAWNVTTALRGTYPEIELPHDHVKSEVHYAMVKHLDAGTYVRTFQGFWLYEPAPVYDAGCGCDGDCDCQKLGDVIDDPEADEDGDPGGDEEDADGIDWGHPVD